MLSASNVSKTWHQIITRIYKGMVHFINILNILLSQFFAAEDLLKKKKTSEKFLSLAL